MFGSKNKSSSELPPEIERTFEKAARMMEDEKLHNLMCPLSIKNRIVGGQDLDELPDAAADFGRSEENPIPATGPIGALVYLSSLKTQDGRRLLYHRLGSVDDIDIYETVSSAGRR